MKVGNNMNGRIVFGSIIMASIIILSSLTSVIAFQSRGSNIKIAKSPLFKVRTDSRVEYRTINTKSFYLGKDRKTIISLPKLRNSIVDKIIEKIKNPYILKALPERYANLLSKLEKSDIIMMFEKLSAKQVRNIENFLQKQKINLEPLGCTNYVIHNPILCAIIFIIAIILYPFIWFIETILSHCFLP